MGSVLDPMFCWGDKAGHAFLCTSCKKLFDRKPNLDKHFEICKGTGQKHIYSGGVYETQESIIDLLVKYNYAVEENFVFPYRAVFDFEAMLEKSDLPQTKVKDSKTSYTNRHVPISVAITSNIPFYDKPVCFVSEGDPQQLVNKMIAHLHAMSSKSFELLKKHFKKVFDRFEVKEVEQHDKTLADENACAKKLRRKFESYLRELPVVGFNSSNYDLNIIKPYLFERLSKQPTYTLPVTDDDTHIPMDFEEGEEEESMDIEEAHELMDFADTETEKDVGKTPPKNIKFIVKQNNQFKCITTPSLKFLDVRSYIAPGFDLSKYLKAFQIKEKKGFFPYEYLTSLDCLQETELPPHAAFYSDLKEKNISEEEYEYCKQVWAENNMQTFKDFLIWYNISDVQPFLQALSKQVEFYQRLGLCMLKDGIGVPGLTLRYLFKTIPDHCYFSLVNEDNKDLHEMMRSQLVGGPSIVFHRYHEKGVTQIRGGKTVASVTGFDANSLYLGSLTKDMPCSHPKRRLKDKDFKIQHTEKFGYKAREWLDWMAHSQAIHIQHKFNSKEKQLGKRHIRV